MAIKKENQKVRTDVENLLLNEMVEEDANYLIMGDYDSDIEAIIPDNVTNNDGLFGSSSSNIFDEEINI